MDFQFTAGTSVCRTTVVSWPPILRSARAVHDRDASHPAWLSSLTLSVTELPG